MAERFDVVIVGARCAARPSPRCWPARAARVRLRRPRAVPKRHRLDTWRATCGRQDPRPAGSDGAALEGHSRDRARHHRLRRCSYRGQRHQWSWSARRCWVRGGDARRLAPRGRRGGGCRGSHPNGGDGPGGRRRPRRGGEDQSGELRAPWSWAPTGSTPPWLASSAPRNTTRRPPADSSCGPTSRTVPQMAICGWAPSETTGSLPFPPTPAFSWLPPFRP